VRIGELARITGISPKTIRYWEEIGVIPHPPRNASGYRIYTPQYVELLSFVLKAKSLGFSLGEIKEIVQIRLSGNEPCQKVVEKISEKIEEIEREIRILNEKKKALEELLKDRRAEPACVCPIIESTG
jgi:DNA-binding transcriptional MerR regulator